jgi:hypothetical protein
MEALPPHTEAPKGYDAAADAAEMDAAPLQDYTSEWTKAKSEAEPTPEPEPKPGDEPKGEGTDEPRPDAEASAREFIECYDILQAYGFHFYSRGKPHEDFALPKFAKDRATHHLAKGLTKMGSPEVPWWLGLLIALVPPGFMNWMAAKEYRQAQADKATAAANAERQRKGQAQGPDTITLKDGTVVPMEEVRRKQAEASPPPPAPPTAPKPTKDHGTCEVCGGPLKHKGRHTCSQECSGKRTARMRKEAKEAKPTAP